MSIEHGTFTPLVFCASGGMAPECRSFYKQLSSLISIHRKETYSAVAAWVKTILSFALIRSAVSCIRGTSHPYYKTIATDTEHIKFEVKSTNIDDE